MAPRLHGAGVSHVDVFLGALFVLPRACRYRPLSGIRMDSTALSFDPHDAHHFGGRDCAAHPADALFSVAWTLGNAPSLGAVDVAALVLCVRDGRRHL